jgi:hypothetical protein
MAEGYIGSRMAARRVCPPRHGGLSMKSRVFGLWPFAPIGVSGSAMAASVSLWAFEARQSPNAPQSGNLGVPAGFASPGLAWSRLRIVPRYG